MQYFLFSYVENNIVNKSIGKKKGWKFERKVWAMKNYPAIAKRKAKAREFLRLFLRQLLPISAINALLFPHVSLLLLLLSLFLFLFHFHFHFHSLIHSLHWAFPPFSQFLLLASLFSSILCHHTHSNSISKTPHYPSS